MDTKTKHMCGYTGMGNREPLYTYKPVFMNGQSIVYIFYVFKWEYEYSAGYIIGHCDAADIE